MGWIAIFVIKNIAHNMPVSGFVLLIIGGLFYTTGVCFYVQKKKKFFHAVWHVFVLMGSLSHYLSVLILFLSKK
jgi:hemolysin III